MKYRNVWEYQEEERKFSPIFLQFSIIIKNSKHFIYLILSKLLLTRIAQTATPAIFTIHLMACNASSIANFFLFFLFFSPILSVFFLTTRSRKAFSHLPAYTRVTVLIVNWLSISDTVRHTNESINGIMHMRSAGLVYRIEIRFIRSSKTPSFPL